MIRPVFSSLRYFLAKICDTTALYGYDEGEDLVHAIQILPYVIEHVRAMKVDDSLHRLSFRNRASRVLGLPYLSLL